MISTSRLAFSVLRADAYLSIILDHPPSVRYQELCIALPKPERLWMASDDDERRRLQWDEAAGRQKALFSFLIRDALVAGNGNSTGSQKLPYRLTKDDFHLGLCALQGGVWEAAREAHSSATGELDLKLAPGDPIQTWRSHLQCWRASMERDTSLRRDYFSSSPPFSSSSDADKRDRDADADALSPFTLLLWHISVLKMHAPLSLLQMSTSRYTMKGHGNRNRIAASTMPVRDPEARMRTWMNSSCPRIAVWSAAQIARIVMREHAAAAAAPAVLDNTSTNNRNAASTSTSGSISNNAVMLNPLAMPGVLMSATVACSYAYHTRTCPACTSGGSISSPPSSSTNPTDAMIDLFETDDDDPRLIRWKEEGHGQAFWGSSSGITLCRCKLDQLATWFCEALSMDEGAKLEFLAFFAALEP